MWHKPANMASASTTVPQTGATAGAPQPCARPTGGNTQVFDLPVGVSYADRGVRNDSHDAFGVVLKMRCKPTKTMLNSIASQRTDDPSENNGVVLVDLSADEEEDSGDVEKASGDDWANASIYDFPLIPTDFQRCNRVCSRSRTSQRMRRSGAKRKKNISSRS